MILQMDIEGAEYDVLTLESAETLSRFSAIIIEFHGLHNMFDKYFLGIISSIFEKLYKNFSICHVHPNNNNTISRLNGVEIPGLIEVTFLRNDLIEKFKSSAPITLPHKLDKRNVKTKRDIKMPPCWWVKS